MFSRPKFLDRFLSLFPDPLAMRFQAVGWTGVVAGFFGFLLVVSSVQLDARRCAEVARERAETLARTAGMWLDGDAHAGLGQAPEKRLADLTSSLEKLLNSSDSSLTLRTLRPRPEARAALGGQPGTPRANALEPVIQTGPNKSKQDVDYRPEMGAALFEGKCVSLRVAGDVVAYAPVPDSWGATPAMVVVQGPATAPLWRRCVFLVAALILAALLVSFVTWAARQFIGRVERQVAFLTSATQELARGQLPGTIALARGAPRELTQLATALEALRARLEAQATGQPLPLAATLETPKEMNRRAELGEAVEFDLALLMQQLVDPARKVAQSRRLDLQLVFPDGVPSQLVGYPMVLYQALDGLLRNALRSTRGNVTLRVSRAGEGPEGWKLRFEVADTGPGIAFKEQGAFGTALAEAASKDPSELKDPLHQASALARSLGGELSFESQPGQGSRFAFTASFQALAPRPVTAFQPRRAPALRGA